jgi:hypothetical protein
MNEVNSHSERSQYPAKLGKMFSPFKFFLILFSVLILINLVYIDMVLFLDKETDITKKLNSLNPSPSPSSQSLSKKELDICPQSCIAQIQEATASLKLSSSPSITPTQISVSSGARGEFFIPFGSGSGFSGDWEDIEGLQVYIDSTNYKGIQKVTFEASVRIPTGNQTAYVRLYNKTDKHPVWFSEVSITGGTPQLLISDSITLDGGNKLYQVQMKTQLKFLTILDQARIHIITN